MSVILLVIAIIFVMTACTEEEVKPTVNTGVDIVVTTDKPLHEGDEMPNIALTEGLRGTVKWKDGQTILGGDNEYLYVYTDGNGKETTFVYGIDAESHTSQKGYIVDIEPFCEKEGMQHMECDKCGKKYNISSIKALPHQFEVSEYFKGNCVTLGYKYTTCKRCGEYKLDENGGKYSELTELGDHEWELEKTKSYPATCEVEGKNVTKCKFCHEEREEILPKVPHDYELYPVQTANCSNEGLAKYRCKYKSADGSYHYEQENGEDITEILPKIPNVHVYNTYINADGEKEECDVCTLCGRPRDNAVPIKEYAINGGENKAKLYLYSNTNNSKYYGLVIEKGTAIPMTNTDTAYPSGLYTSRITWYDDVIENHKVRDRIKHVFVEKGTETYINNSETSETLPHATFYNHSALEHFTVGDLPLSDDSTNGDTFTVPDFCFANCPALSSIDFQYDNIAVGEYSFANCRALKFEDIDYSLSQVKEGAFMNCTSLDSIDFAKSPEPEPMKIDKMAFLGCKLDYIILPANSTVAAGDYGDIPQNFETGEYYKGYRGAFSLGTMATVENIRYQYRPNTIIYVLGNEDKTNTNKMGYNAGTVVYFVGDRENLTIDQQGFHTVKYKEGTNQIHMGTVPRASLTDPALYGIPKIANSSGTVLSYTPANVTDEMLQAKLDTISDLVIIGDNSMANRQALTTVKIPKTVMYLGSNAFYNARNLETFTFVDQANSKLQYIGSSVFAYTDIKNITIPSKVDRIGYNIFETNLTKVMEVQFNAVNASLLHHDGSRYLNNGVPSFKIQDSQVIHPLFMGMGQSQITVNVESGVTKPLPEAIFKELSPTTVTVNEIQAITE